MYVFASAQWIVALTTHQQGPLGVAPLQVVDVGTGDPDGAQHLQAEQGQQRLVAQVWVLHGVRVGRARRARCRLSRWSKRFDNNGRRPSR